MTDHKRPTTSESPHSSRVTTPRASMMMQLLGPGMRTGSVTFSGDEFKAIQKLYGFVPEKPNKKPDPPDPPKREDFSDPNTYRANYLFSEALKKHQEALKALDRWEDPRPIMQAGADRNAVRYAEEDGLRMIAWIAQYVEPGGDPVRTLVQLALDAGWDVDPEDAAWAEGMGDDEESEGD